MRIITYKRILEFCEKYPDADVALQLWYHKSNNSEWHNINDIKKTFGSVDYAGNNRYIFNIKGNHYRLVVIIIFVSQKIYIRFIGTHAEYDKIDCSVI